MVDFMILIWFWYGWFFVLWLCHRNLMFSVTPTTTIPKAPSPIPSCAMVFFLALRFCVCGPPAPTRATQHRKPTTANKHGTWLPPQQSHSQSWNMDGSDLKSQAQKNQIVYLCICHSRLTRIIPGRPWLQLPSQKEGGLTLKNSLSLSVNLAKPMRCVCV